MVFMLAALLWEKALPTNTFFINVKNICFLPPKLTLKYTVYFLLADIFLTYS